MLRRLRNIDSEDLELLKSKLGQLNILMTEDVSKYAKGRFRLWLFHEANLAGREITEAHFDPELWKVAQRTYKGSTTALLTYGGKWGNHFYSDAGIKWHRDANFALETARLINVSGEAVFGYDTDRSGNMEGAPSECEIQLGEGEVIEFNCKHRHCIKSYTEGRYGLILWKTRPESAAPGYKLCSHIEKLLAR